MKIYESGENYLETILMLTKRHGNVRSIDIATELNVSKPSVSVAMKQLRENGYINVDEAGHIILSQKGMDIAKKMYERHLVLQKVFVAMGVSEETAISDACKIEHDLSEESFNAIKAFYNKLISQKTE